MSAQADVSPMAMLDRYGPGSTRTASRADARAYVRALVGSRSENFSVLSRLVPPGLRGDFAAVYAFCRWADDLGDETGSDAVARGRSLELLAWWRAELDGCFAGRARHPVFVALHETVRRHALRPEPFGRLIDAFEMDQRITDHPTWASLLTYCGGSANPVGHLVLQLGGVRPPDEAPENAALYARSDDLCSALQLTNFWQDVRRDLLERTRVYLPADETGVDRATLTAWLDRGDDPEVARRYAQALRGLVDRTWALFDRGASLPGSLGRPMGPVVWLLAGGGRRVLRAVERGGLRTLWTRPTLGPGAKARLIMRAWLGARLGRVPGGQA